MITSVDTNILLDILIPKTKFCLKSKQLLDEAIQKGSIIINEVVYAELSSQFKKYEDLEFFLEDTGVKLIPTNKKALYLAGEMWKLYFRRKKKGLQCSNCGKIQEVFCERCGTKISNRQHIITDFIIGAFALLQSNIFLTRDRGFYKDYFKNLIIKTPSQ
ncbi:nucleotide-binding protein [Candidatus Desulfofervidus auxilii]|uniref:Nucleotide-binding protein n=1 Tax=Desulfofervidus auxilii TaxID=1621989 RepID=A0A7U4QMW5_DESA2|nr:type II toxin-antitoxin system VapC family toxin [Candidatus Desulfofervidus auxilii]CAD7777573.1 MAG: hypothetical protein KCCBMMGE_00560 [Candidatus Methanoperedenaceae archaeon GB37]CAD7778681.1 MAG: hypothetical protein KIIPBIDF_01077 [Candidatus Methanoperedenaceae archaeon GB50]AMM42282.1 nucleotide-binding protein [Candidatus Desulfofervidus auxilii]MDL1965588.1 type II toxin-antitoxin system VapC family toxin [Candidatus Desulfofervidus auxilii]CAD7781642.1 hypothetical protein BLFG